MLYSMTGFGAAVYKGENLSISVELKAVNNRFFKLSLRLSDGYAVLEHRIETILRSVIGRGTVNAGIRVVRSNADTGYQINQTILQSYVKQLADVVDSLGHTDCLWPLDRLLTLPGVVVTDRDNTEEDIEQTWRVLEKTLRDALRDLQTMRKTEGEAMRKDLTSNIESLRQSIGNITELAPNAAPNYRDKLKERIDTAMKEWMLEEQLEDVSDARNPCCKRAAVLSDPDFVRELAIYADKCDISEEIVRFQSHLEQFSSAIQSPESCGRKLDFLSQELFREANTISSKANDADITRHVVEIKAVVERIREMVQNVE